MIRVCISTISILRACTCKSIITSSYGFTNTIKRGFNNYYDNRNIRLSITYKFGNNNIKVNDRKLSNEDERNRAGK